MEKDYDLVVSIGQVVPHEVVGMANYNKNIFVGCGGKEIIDKSHFLGAVYGMERIMSRTTRPAPALLDYAEEQFLGGMPLQYILTVTTAAADGGIRLHGLFIGRERRVFEEAVRCQEHNLTSSDRPAQGRGLPDPAEFKSTWLGNKAVYRLRMAVADGGELIIIAPWVSASSRGG